MSANLADRFWAHVDRTAGCWLWTGSRAASGHGRFLIGRKVEFAHRVAWELENGPIPNGLLVCHNCPGGDNPTCVRPSHMFLGTHRDNTNDAFSKGMIQRLKLAFCQRGHPMTEENRYHPPARPHKSMCRTCHLERAARFHDAHPRPIPACLDCQRPVVDEPTGRRLPTRCGTCQRSRTLLVGRTNMRRYRAAEGMDTLFGKKEEPA